ncbi:hypothetical protein Lesp02_79430 [Lentzea sp. NBRC 105346]|uniref:permease prefix domain 1-containing protein n=1 Tax=Lentzea sp. NBRC 105346 TaxID=3032205 RepID=UPI0024A21D94|nr:permease prefix domain 1-containing protein [Lentzea sp. NBRC 105346]GLZ35756.1 hypothetical protein Lesp02_79430 [Lentzea sp. NBRC 105346]
MIDDYVGELGGRLRGLKNAKLDLLAETRDSLTDAVEAYLRKGVDEAEAHRRAVAEFGPVDEIAVEYQEELAVSYGARTLQTMAIVLPLMHMLWELNRWLFIGSWSDFRGPVPHWYILIAKANDMTGGVAAGVAIAALIAGRYLSRGRTRAITMARLAGGIAMLSVVVVILGNIAIAAATVQIGAQIDLGRLALSPPMFVVTAGSWVALGMLGVLARRCLSCATIVS